jgi:Ca2+-binding RTX toxin-like protein
MGEVMRRRVALVLAAMALALLLASGVAWAVNEIGTDGPDTLRGTNRGDNLSGEGGNDVLFGLGGSDNLLGGEGKDYVLGGNERIPLGGDKNLAGGPGNDAVFGGNGSDTVLGGSGNDDLGSGRGSDSVAGEEGRDIVNGQAGSDHLAGGEGPDWVVTGDLRETSKNTLSGGEGDDALIASNRPAVRDVVSCGGGFDLVVADRKDLVAPDCERVRRGVSEQEIDELFAELGFVEVFEGLAPSPFE